MTQIESEAAVAKKDGESEEKKTKKKPEPVDAKERDSKAPADEDEEDEDDDEPDKDEGKKNATRVAAVTGERLKGMRAVGIRFVRRTSIGSSFSRAAMASISRSRAKVLS